MVRLWMVVGVGLVAANSCPDLSTLRSPAVVDSFDPSLLTGLFFEAAYIDPAQAGASCQTLNSSYASTGVLTMPFSVTYFNNHLPFTIVEQYTPSEDGSVPGLYDKIALPPTPPLDMRLEANLHSDNINGGRRRLDLVLPTVVVDVTHSDNETATEGAPYDTMTLYSCLDLGADNIVVELIFASKNSSLSSGDLNALEATARAAGIQWNDDDLTYVNHSQCP